MRKPNSRRISCSDMQNWNIAVTAFSKTPLLDTIKTPEDLRRLKVEQARQVADELRQATIDAVSASGGPFGGGRGVGDRRPLRCGSRRRRADRRDPLRVRHPPRPPDLGRWPPGLSAQDPDR